MSRRGSAARRAMRSLRLTTRRVVLVSTVVTMIAAGLMVGLGWSEVRRSDIPGIGLSAAASVAALLTLWYVVPSPARITVDRQDELELSDLIFYLVDIDGRRVPRDFLLQVHVAIANVGGRRGVVSRVAITKLETANGHEVVLPEAPRRHDAVRYRHLSGWRNHVRYSESVIEPGPWVLASDDVITLRFRCRRGIDWSPRFDLARIRAMHDTLAEPIVKAIGEVTWRSGRIVRRDEFEIRLEVVKQREYVDALEQITEGFSVRPTVAPQPIEIE